MKANSMLQNDFLSLNSYSKIKTLSSTAIRSVISMEDSIFLMENAFRNTNNGSCQVPLRSVVENPEKTITVFFKPAFDKALNRFVIKILSQNENNKLFGTPTITGIVLLLDGITGKIISIMDGDTITSLRTGATSGMASKYLSRTNSKTLALFGCGVQGRSQIDAVMAVRQIEKVYLYDNDRNAGEKMLVEYQDKYNISFEYTQDLNNLKSADIICTATGSRKPLFSKDQLKKGVHINAIGSYKPDMQEIAPEIMKAAGIYIDQRKACLSETGDLIIPIKEGFFDKSHLRGEISELLNGLIAGRTSEDEITVFKSVGIAAQDLYLANGVYENSLKATGQKVKKLKFESSKVHV